MRHQISISHELNEKLKSLRVHERESYDTTLRRLAGLPVTAMLRSTPYQERPEYAQVESLEPGQSVVLAFEWDEPGRPALNARLLSQVVRRVRERKSWRLITEGTAAGLKVTRIA